jgi:NitT/TauT family transport system ATP-binding protein
MPGYLDEIKGVVGETLFGSAKNEPAIPITQPVESSFDPSTYEDVDVINLRNITQVYDDGHGKNVLFDNFNFDIKDIRGEGQFVSLLGKSGCGKSTILRYITGLQQPTSGEVIIYGKPKTEDDRIPMIFQQYSSLEHYSVIKNVALPLLDKGVNKTEAFDRAEEMIKVVDLVGHEKKWAKSPLLSGGQLQRVAIARSLVANPKILVLDEPFSALDIKTRNELQNVLLKLFRNDKIDVTFILVTHDIREAVYLSNKLFMMKSGPGQIHKQFSIDLGKNRDQDIKYSTQYNNYVQMVEREFSTLK